MTDIDCLPLFHIWKNSEPELWEEAILEAKKLTDDKDLIFQTAWEIFQEWMSHKQENW